MTVIDLRVDDDLVLLVPQGAHRILVSEKHCVTHPLVRPLPESTQAVPVDVMRHPYARQFRHRRHEVEQLRERPRLPRQNIGPGNNERTPDAVLVKVLLAEQPMAPYCQTVVGGIDDQRTLRMW